MVIRKDFIELGLVSWASDSIGRSEEEEPSTDGEDAGSAGQEARGPEEGQGQATCGEEIAWCRCPERGGHTVPFGALQDGSNHSIRTRLSVQSADKRRKGHAGGIGAKTARHSGRWKR